MSNFLSGIAVVLSALAFIVSGFTAYQVFGLRQAIESADPATRQALSPAQPAPTPSVDGGSTSSQDTALVPNVASQAAGGITEIQPGQFVQNAFGTKAQVELLSVKRIKDPEVGTPDVVNVQFRIRRLAAEITGTGGIGVSQTTARNPETSEIYKAVSYDRSTGTLTLFTLRRGASADAYVWLRVPEGVSTLDILIPETGAFKNVPISS